MRRYKKGEINTKASASYRLWVAADGLYNAMKVHAELGRLLRAEKKRREAIDHK